MCCFIRPDVSTCGHLRIRQMTQSSTVPSYIVTLCKMFNLTYMNTVYCYLHSDSIRAHDNSEWELSRLVLTEAPLVNRK